MADFTYDVTTELGTVRLLIPDKIATDPIFLDIEIQAFLNLGGSNVARAAAIACETIATDQLLLLKAVTHVADISLDGAAVSQQLLARAKRLREMADTLDDDDESEASSGIIVAEQINSDSAYRNWLLRIQAGGDFS
jgi:hypothetical protein